MEKTLVVNEQRKQYPEVEVVAQRNFSIARKVTTFHDVEDVDVSDVFRNGPVRATATFEASQVFVWTEDHKAGRMCWRPIGATGGRLLSVQMEWVQYGVATTLGEWEMEQLLKEYAPRPLAAIFRGPPCGDEATYADSLARALRGEFNDEIVAAGEAAIADERPE